MGDKLRLPAEGARLAPVIGAHNRDAIRNTRLVLAAKGRIEKRGPGQYQARKVPHAPSTPPSTPEAAP